MTDEERAAEAWARCPTPPWRTIECYGGPWDGYWLCFIGEIEDIEFRGTGVAVHRYELGEVYEGPRVRPVLRYVVPLPRREG